MWLKTRTLHTIGEYRYRWYQAYLNDCRTCSLQTQCMRKPPKQHGRQLAVKVGVAQAKKPNVLSQMRTKIDSDQGRYIYSQRIGTVETVFGNMTINKRLNRFTLRGKDKVNAQWLLWCMVYNIEKIHHYGDDP